MPVPADLSGKNEPMFANVWTGTLGVAGAVRTGGYAPRMLQKRFITCIEIFEQTAHDAGLHGFAKERKITPRRAHKGQVAPANNGADRLAYYAVHGQEAAAMVAEYMTATWNATVNTNNNCFVQKARNTLASQGMVRHNGFSYEITMWYDGNDVYVAFHCYENL